jgi:hypothetical protein
MTVAVAPTILTLHQPLLVIRPTTCARAREGSPSVSDLIFFLLLFEPIYIPAYKPKTKPSHNNSEPLQL